MKKYRPTTLRIFEENCPAALDFFMAKQGGAAQGQDRMDAYSKAEREIEGNEQADIGIAFHACMHGAAEAAIKDKPIDAAIQATALAITKQMDPSRARAGEAMATAFVYLWQVDKRLQYEHGLAFDTKWKLTGWDAPDYRLRMVLDVYGMVEEETEDGTLKVAISEDYKTGWGATANILDGIQMKAHSSALYSIHGKETDYIEVRVHATRFRRVFSKRWDLSNLGDVEDLENRRRDVEFFMNAGDQSDGVARIGAGCILCDFKVQCTAFQQRVAEIKGGDIVNIALDPQGAARDFALIHAEHARLQAGLKLAAKAGAFEFGAKQLGYTVSKKRTIKDPREMVEFWFDKVKVSTVDEAKSAARGLVQAMEPGVTQVDKMLKKVARAIGYKSQKEAIEKESPRFTKVEEQQKFGWSKKEQLDAAGADEEHEE